MEELEEMRGQLDALKRQLDTQQIVNQDLMRKVMRGNASWLNGFVNVEIIALPFLYFLIAGICYLLDISQWYASAWLFLGVIDVMLDWRMVRIPPSMFSESSILELKKLLLRQHKGRFVQTCVMLPLALIWLMTVGYLFFTKLNVAVDDELLHAAKIGGLVGALIGCVVSVVVVVAINKKIQRTNDSILNDIHDLEAEN